MKIKTCLTCIGTRPEIIKMAPVHKALQKLGHRSLILHTGQHGAIADALYDFFDMKPALATTAVIPGSVVTHQQFLAATFGREKHDLVALRYAWGSEGYLAISENSTLVNFQSKDFGVMWRHWIDSRSGFLVDLNHYRNPAYERSGVNVGAFHQFD